MFVAPACDRCSIEICRVIDVGCDHVNRTQRVSYLLSRFSVDVMRLDVEALAVRSPHELRAQLRLESRVWRSSIARARRQGSQAAPSLR
jgi:hypothetical protein